MFFDLNVPGSRSEEERARVRKRASQLGWHCIATTTTYKGESLKRPPQEGSPETGLQGFALGSDGSADAEADLIELSRIHLDGSHIEDNVSLIPKCRKAYDLVSCRPTSEESFRKICTLVDCDIVSLDLSQPLPFRIAPSHAQAALKRGLVFEITYSNLLLDDSLRKNVFCNARALCRCTRGKGIVISSGTRSALDLRSPLDVVNIGTLFNLKEKQAREALDANCLGLVERAANAKTFTKGFCLREEANESVQDKYKVKRRKC